MATQHYYTETASYGESKHASLGEMLNDWRERVCGHLSHGWKLDSVTREPMPSGVIPGTSIGRMLVATMTQTYGVNGFQRVNRVVAYSFNFGAALANAANS